MESPPSVYTREEQQKLLTPHEYTGINIKTVFLVDTELSLHV
jgi:hypothetical protein